MSGYSPDQLDRARAPFRTAEDRDAAVCVLGHMMTEQREAHSDERSGFIAAITAAVRDFDTRVALGGTSAPSAAAPEMAAQVAQAQSPPALPAPPPPPAPAPVAVVPPVPASTAGVGINPSATMQRELRRQGLIKADHQQDGGSASMQMETASMQRELRRAGLTPRDAA